jgi:cytochrome d ubiquinol oxidase subunit II
VISHWANASHGLDTLLNPWILVFGLAVLFLARTLGILYMMNNINDDDIRTRSRYQLAGSAFVFVVLFVVYLVHLLLKDGFAYDDSGTIFMEPNKYLHNMIDMWYLTVILLIGVVLVLYGIGKELLSGSNFFTFHFSLFTLSGIWPAGIGTVLTVTPLLLMSAWNHTAYYPSTADLQSSLTLENSCSSYFTLNTMFWVSLLVPFVLAYIVYAWRKIDSKKIDRAEIEADDHAY